ncbi:1792_t:CDS:2, partial [Dentiscutata heterogama]
TIVIRYALHESNTKAAAKFGLDKSQVGYWVTKLKDQLSEVGHKKSCHLGGGGRKDLKLVMLRIDSETALKSHELAKRRLASSFKASSTCSEDDEIYHDEIFDNRTHQISDEIHCDKICHDKIFSDEICSDEISSENIIIIDSSEDEDNNTNQDIFVEDDEEVLIFATNQ